MPPSRALSLCAVRDRGRGGGGIIRRPMERQRRAARSSCSASPPVRRLAVPTHAFLLALEAHAFSMALGGALLAPPSVEAPGMGAFSHVRWERTRTSSSEAHVVEVKGVAGILVAADGLASSRSLKGRGEFVAPRLSSRATQRRADGLRPGGSRPKIRESLSCGRHRMYLLQGRVRFDRYSTELSFRMQPRSRHVI